MNLLHAVGVGCAVVLGVACAGQNESDVVPSPHSLGAPIAREGTVYTPASVGPEGCVLYNIRVPDGEAPAAMAYQSTEGRFSYGRPDSCIKPVGLR